MQRQAVLDGRQVGRAELGQDQAVHLQVRVGQEMLGQVAAREAGDARDERPQVLPRVRLWPDRGRAGGLAILYQMATQKARGRRLRRCTIDPHTSSTDSRH